MLELEYGSKLCDLGCDDGKRTTELARATKAKEVFGVEIVKDQAYRAMRLGIKVTISDLNHALPFANDSFDILCANQVIEHLYDTDKFIAEIHRTLRKKGVAIISTENIASWHNIFVLLFGWQPFSSTNISSRNIGNPLALHKMDDDKRRPWQHQRIFS